MAVWGGIRPGLPPEPVRWMMVIVFHGWRATDKARARCALAQAGSSAVVAALASCAASRRDHQRSKR